MKFNQRVKPHGGSKHDCTAKLAPQSTQSDLRAYSCDRIIAIVFLRQTQTLDIPATGHQLL